VVGTAADGEEVLALAAELEPDVILMDLRMPRMDGVDQVCPTPRSPSAW
jgi:YesN/AraC family two-component response regulator